MSDLLERIYGTDGEEALEKAAQAQFIDKLAAEHDVDLSELSPEQLETLEAAVVKDLEEQGHLHKEADADVEEVEDEEMIKAAAAYDAYGRVMAHGFAEELQKLAEPEEEAEIYVDEEGNEYTAEEAAEMQKEALPSWLGNLLASGASAGKATGKALKGAALAKGVRGGATEVSRALKMPKGMSARKSQLKSGGKRLAKGMLGTGGLYGGAAGGVGGTALLMKGKKKKASALDALAEERALEVLSMFEGGVEKTAADEELDNAITTLAFDKLAAAGYNVEGMIEALQTTEE
jgi:hypothetical protein